jgi:hypothetical protein
MLDVGYLSLTDMAAVNDVLALDELTVCRLQCDPAGQEVCQHTLQPGLSCLDNFLELRLRNAIYLIGLNENFSADAAIWQLLGDRVGQLLAASRRALINRGDRNVGYLSSSNFRPAPNANHLEFYHTEYYLRCYRQLRMMAPKVHCHRARCE